MRDNYIVIQGWMVTDLHLKGNDLLVYAIIWGFTQNVKAQKYEGSIQYLADWTGSTKQGIVKNLKNLLDAKLIEKEVFGVGKSKRCVYKATELTDIQLSCHKYTTELLQSIQLSLPNNISIQDKENIDSFIKDYISKKIYSQKSITYQEKKTPDEKDSGGSKESKSINVNAEEKTSQDDNVNNVNNVNNDNAENTAKVNEVLKLFTALCPSLPSVKKITAERKRHISARFTQGYTIDDFRQVFTKAEASDFCRGINGRNWKADFDFLISDSGFTKTLEGKYDNKDANGNVSTTAHGVPRKIAYRRYRDVDGSDFDLVVKMDGSTMNITKAYDDGRTESFQCKVGSEPAWIK